MDKNKYLISEEVSDCGLMYHWLKLIPVGQSKSAYPLLTKTDLNLLSQISKWGFSWCVLPGIPWRNFDWLEERLRKLGPDVYVLPDSPGQVKLSDSTNHESVKRIVEKLFKLGFRVRCASFFIGVWGMMLIGRWLLFPCGDARYIKDASTYISCFYCGFRAMPVEFELTPRQCFYPR